jgi:hypothetical protein
MLGLVIFQKQIQRLGFDLEQLFGADVAKEGLAFADLASDPLVNALKQFWSEQGDYLS